MNFQIERKPVKRRASSMHIKGFSLSSPFTQPQLPFCFSQSSRQNILLKEQVHPVIPEWEEGGQGCISGEKSERKVDVYDF